VWLQLLSYPGQVAKISHTTEQTNKVLPSTPLFMLCMDLLLMAECCFTSIETIGLLGMGAQDGHLDFHTAPEISLLLTDDG